MGEGVIPKGVNPVNKALSGDKSTTTPPPVSPDFVKMDSPVKNASVKNVMTFDPKQLAAIYNREASSDRRVTLKGPNTIPAEAGTEYVGTVQADEKYILYFTPRAKIVDGKEVPLTGDIPKFPVSLHQQEINNPDKNIIKWSEGYHSAFPWGDRRVKQGVMEFDHKVTDKELWKKLQEAGNGGKPVGANMSNNGQSFAAANAEMPVEGGFKPSFPGGKGPQPGGRSTV